MIANFTFLKAQHFRRCVAGFLILLLLENLFFPDAWAGAIGAMQQMQKRKAAGAQQAVLRAPPQGQQRPQPTHPATPAPLPVVIPEKPLPPAQDIKETIDRVMSSPKEWLRIKDDRIKDLVIEYMLNRFQDEGLSLEKQPPSQYRKKIDLMIKTYPNLLDEKSMPEILKSVANLELDYIQAMYDTKHPPEPEPEVEATSPANAAGSGKSGWKFLDDSGNDRPN